MFTGHALPRPSVLKNPLVRIVLIGTIALILLVLILIITIVALRSAYSHPLEVAVYPNAQLVTKSEKGQSDLQTYSTDDSVQDVLGFYESRISTQDGNGCKKIYIGKEVSEEPAKVSGRCIVSNSLLDATQSLSIRIDYAPDGTTGKTIILIERTWGG
jgi:hypothetical protein